MIRMIDWNVRSYRAPDFVESPALTQHLQSRSQRFEMLLRGSPRGHPSTGLVLVPITQCHNAGCFSPDYIIDSLYYNSLNCPDWYVFTRIV